MNPLTTLLTRLTIKEELSEIGKFTVDQNIREHLRKFNNKIKEIGVDNNEKSKLLIKSLTEDVILILKANEEYDSNVDNYEWLETQLLDEFSGKESMTSRMAELLKIKQKDFQSTKEFLNMVKVEGMRRLHGVPRKDCDQMLVMTFIQGLLNKKARIVLKEIKPGSLKEAYEAIKYEVSSNEEPKEELYQIREDRTLFDLKRQLNDALKRIEKLEAKIER